MVASVCQSLGWTWDHVEEEMDLVRLGHFNKYWQRNPPVHEAVARYLGYGETAADGEGPATTARESAPGELLDMLGADFPPAADAPGPAPEPASAAAPAARL